MTQFYEWLAVPFGWILGAFYEISNNYLLALVIITLLSRLVLLPSSIKQQKNQAKQMRLQAKVNKIRAKYAGQQGRDIQMKISEETQELYRREGFNATTAGCAPLVIQLVVMMGLYGAIYSPLSKVLHLSDAVMDELKNVYVAFSGQEIKAGSRYELNLLHDFNNFKELLNPEIITADIQTKIEKLLNGLSIGGIDLTQVPKEDIKSILVLIPVLAGLSALLTAVYTYLRQRKTNPEMANNPAMGCMSFSSPLISVVFAFTLPAGIGVYWILSNILSFIQMIALAAAVKPENIIAEQMIDETVQRRSREESIKKTKALVEQNRKNN